MLGVLQSAPPHIEERECLIGVLYEREDYDFVVKNGMAERNWTTKLWIIIAVFELMCACVWVFLCVTTMLQPHSHSLAFLLSLCLIRVIFLCLLLYVKVFKCHKPLSLLLPPPFPCHNVWNFCFRSFFASFPYIPSL